LSNGLVRSHAGVTAVSAVAPCIAFFVLPGSLIIAYAAQPDADFARDRSGLP